MPFTNIITIQHYRRRPLPKMAVCEIHLLLPEKKGCTGSRCANDGCQCPSLRTPLDQPRYHVTSWTFVENGDGAHFKIALSLSDCCHLSPNECPRRSLNSSTSVPTQTSSQSSQTEHSAHPKSSPPFSLDIIRPHHLSFGGPKRLYSVTATSPLKYRFFFFQSRV